MPTLLVIDDEPSIQHAFRRAFRAPDITLLTASTAAEGLRHVAEFQPDVVVLDLNLPDLSGLEAYKQLHQLDARIPVVFITGQGTTETAIEAMKLGAYDYLLKPLELDQLRDLVNRAFEISRLMRVPALVGQGVPPHESADALVGHCPAMQEIYKAIGRVAHQDVTVLILGESGTGKELVARAIYQHSHRSAPAVSGDQLCGDPGEPPGERAVRSRERGLHRCRSQAHRQIRAMLGRHAVSR